MCADFDLIKRAKILAAAVMLTVVNSTADVLVCVFGSHNHFSLKVNLRFFPQIYFRFFSLDYSCKKMSELRRKSAEFNLFNLFRKIGFNQNLKQLVAVDMTNKSARVVERCNICRVFGKDIADKLVYRIVAFLF